MKEFWVWTKKTYAAADATTSIVRAEVIARIETTSSVAALITTANRTKSLCKKVHSTIGQKSRMQIVRPRIPRAMWAESLFEGI